jgi:acyl-CoA synthetase (AMP-forming)/AMP-acid ligase II
MYGMDLVVKPVAASPIPRTILDEAETVTGAVAELVRRFPNLERLSFIDRRRVEQRMSFAALWTRARQIQHTLTQRGLRPGGMGLLVLPTGPELVAGYFGVMLAGGTPSIIATPFHRFADPRVYAAHVGPILDLARAQVLYAEPDVAALCASHPSVHQSATAIVTPAEVGGTEPAAEPPEADPDGIAMVQYTSGSTGVPKGVLLTHRAMLNNMRATRDGLGVYAHDVSLNWAPLYHDMGLIDTLLRPLLSGSHTVLIPTGEFLREPALWLWAIHHYRATISWAPNFAYTLCAKRLPQRDIEGLDLSSWRVAVNASEPVLANSVEVFADRFRRHGYRPEAMTPAWGVAEAVCIATAHPVGEEPVVETLDRQALATANVARPVAAGGLQCVGIGKCLPHCHVEVRDAEGHVLGDRQVGTIWLRTRSLFSGYQHHPELTAQVFVDGWFNTGDRGYVHQGHLFFISREKDLIVLGGEKYAPHDIEVAINRVPDVREGCAVAFGVLNEERGTEDVAAVVETRVTDVEHTTALRDAIRAEVAGSTGLALRYVVLVPPGGIEKTTSGKLARNATRRRYADQLAG